MSEEPLRAVTTDHYYLAAILAELKALRAIMVRLDNACEGIVIANSAEGQQTVELREPEVKGPPAPPRRGRPAKKD